MVNLVYDIFVNLCICDTEMNFVDILYFLIYSVVDERTSKTFQTLCVCDTKMRITLPMMKQIACWLFYG